MTVKQLLKDTPKPNEDTARHYLIGNLRRCLARLGLARERI
jgi:aerobic-type carbon monoxide dehydrogenase small subunit (CoxS/CutS family)